MCIVLLSRSHQFLTGTDLGPYCIISYETGQKPEHNDRWRAEMGRKTNHVKILHDKYYDWDEKRREEQDGKRRCRLATSEGAWVWQMLSVMTICPEQQRCWTAGFKAAPSNSSKWSGGEDLWTKGCAERGARATPLLYNFNLWWMIAEERSGGDKYESICPGRSSIMPQLLTFDLAGENISSSQENYLSDNWRVLIKLAPKEGWSVRRNVSTYIWAVIHIHAGSSCRVSMHNCVLKQTSYLF